MIIYRFVHSKFAGELNGTGARLWGGRWNPVGVPVIYASTSISLALLEVLANALTLEQLQLMQLMEITIPDEAESASHEIKLQSLKKNWQQDFDYTQWMGQQVLGAGKSLLIRCPSAIVQKECNILINPLHLAFKKLYWDIVNDFYFDERLFKSKPISLPEL